ncbi:MAG: hypothetical protein PHC28_04695 [Flavobacterium sp.]|uniref:hypothetical protein n=1 Tax=Flavobacterium sp. TaxID=239 RepID=UPI0026087CB5|nr:hypothetical protein [Flavobacterium sp.]MDD5149763.1 hypothetical protein [Flavobacterium sp.]
MKHFKYYTSFLTLFFLVTACQTSSVEEVHSTLETISSTTPLTTDVKRVAMKNTSQDDIIDKSNCFMIKFPYSVTVNNVTISINTSSDYQLVLNNINANTNDNDIVSIHFPITVTFEDYTEKSIANQTNFNSLVAECQSNLNDFGKINCITISYPIVVNVYDSNNQIASAISINDNLSLYNFIANLAVDKYISISYPINVKDENDQNIIITSNNQLEDVIKSAVDNCSENNVVVLDFMQTITANSWKISYYYNENNRTSYYNGYVFTFNSDFTVIATKSGNTYNGTWSTKIDNGVREFTIKFQLDALGKLDEDWKVFEFNISQLRFRSEDGLNENDYLYFEKN